jgi:predicted RNA-binding protein YlxR (DUF448 family)
MLSGNKPVNWDPFAHMGRGGWVYHNRNAAAADKSRAFAVEFFKSNLGAK